MKKNPYVIKIKENPNIRYQFTQEDIERMVKECFYEHEDFEEIKRVFKALAKM